MSRVTDLAVLGACACVAIGMLRAPTTDHTAQLSSDTSVLGDRAPDAPNEANQERVSGSGWVDSELRPSHRRFRMGDLTPELIDASLVTAADIDPALAQRLRALSEQDDAEFRRTIARSHRLLTLADLRLREPAMYELKLVELRTDAQVVTLARDWRTELAKGDAANASELARIEGELRTMLRLQLGFGLRAREDLLCRLQDIVSRLEKELEHDRVNFDALVSERMEQCRDEGGPPPLGRP